MRANRPHNLAWLGVLCLAACAIGQLFLVSLLLAWVNPAQAQGFDARRALQEARVGQYSNPPVVEVRVRAQTRHLSSKSQRILTPQNRSRTCPYTSPRSLAFTSAAACCSGISRVTN